MGVRGSEEALQLHREADKHVLLHKCVSSVGPDQFGALGKVLSGAPLTSQSTLLSVFIHSHRNLIAWSLRFYFT